MNSLTEAPQEIQLAVDLIYLLETSEITPDIVLKALEIVKNDYISKQQIQAAQTASIEKP